MLGTWRFALAGVMMGALLSASTSAGAQANASTFEEARAAFASAPVESRITLQILLTAAGYWNAVPNETFGKRLFASIQRFQSENGFPPTGVLDKSQVEKLARDGVNWLANWGFRPVKHPSRSVSIWVPFGLGVQAERNSQGVTYRDPNGRITLHFTSVPNAGIADNYRAVLNLVTSERAKIHYNVIKDGWYVVSATAQDGTDYYLRYHQDRTNVTGFTLSWKNTNGIVHGERIAILMSGSLWSNMTGAAFVDPLTPASDGPKATTESETPAPAPQRDEQKKASQGTGFFVTSEGHVLTNQHVIDGCSSISVAPEAGQSLPARIAAADKENDLALLKVDHRPSRFATLRVGARLGEEVAVFGYPLASLLATSGNFTLGNVTALAGLGDDTRFLQISAPVQPGNSGGPLLDRSGNAIGVVSGKLNATKTAEISGDIPQNVNFAVKASAAAMFLEMSQVSFGFGTNNAPLAPADLADKAKELSVFITCK
jgi:S1-C subfamily serine protease